MDTASDMHGPAFDSRLPVNVIRSFKYALRLTRSENFTPLCGALHDEQKYFRTAFSRGNHSRKSLDY